ncbi:MAG: SIMPL domain-containing protein [Methanoregula sp.]|nr:SIMPL domain-containing protein [Methanoregula sp.]
MMRRIVLISAALLLVFMAAVGSAAALSLDGSTERVIHASGSGTVIGTPDRAQVSLAIEIENPEVKVAQQENAARMTTVIDALVAAGIPRDALKTTGYSIYPVYADSKSPEEQKIRTYRVTNTLTVTLHDVSRTGEVIDIAVANGINQASSIQFMLSDEQAQVLRTEALKKAVASARADADTVASALGVRITNIMDVDIGGGYTPVLYDNYMVGNAMKSAAPTPIQPGDVTVSATISVTYLIR